VLVLLEPRLAGLSVVCHRAFGQVFTFVGADHNATGRSEQKRENGDESHRGGDHNMHATPRLLYTTPHAYHRPLLRHADRVRRWFR